MRILVYGAGVIGCELAHELCKGNNEVTILARGRWRDTINDNGLIIRHYAQFHSTKDYIRTIEKLEAGDQYDLIFVVMQYSQVMEILPQLAANVSHDIIFIGNNMNPAYCMEQISSQSDTDKEIAFGFQGSGGRRENGKVISVHLRIGMTVGGLRGPLSSEFHNKIIEAFVKTGYRLTWEKNMESWLVCHLAFILPMCYICYHLDCNLKSITKEQISKVIDAVVEAHQLLKKLGYQIRPDGEEEFFLQGRQKNQKLLYLMAKTPFGKLAASDHCAHAVEEMSVLDEAFEELRKKTDCPMPVWEELRNIGQPAKYKK